MDTQKNKIFFRADAGPQIGYGHFIRSLALADMLKEDFDCTFFTQKPTEYQLKELQAVCPCIPLPADDSKFQLFLDQLTGNEIVVLDNYFFTTDYQRVIKAKGCKLVCIDDMHDKHYVADVVINHGCYKSEVFDVEPYTRLCLGLDWALLRKPFLEAAQQQTKRTYSNKIEKVVICFGGSDILHLTEKAIDNILQNGEIQRVDAIVSDSFNENAYKNNARVHFYHNISAQTVANLFIHCDLAIVSASSVCIEALACGARVAAGWYVDNQREFYEYLKKENRIYPLENFNIDLELQLEHFKKTKFFSGTNIFSNYHCLFNSL